MDVNYFSIDTYSKLDKINEKEDKIISIQFQKLDLKTFEKKGKLFVLKEWESCEENIIKQVHNWFFTRSFWEFCPVGFNLNFCWKFLFEKFKKYNISFDEKIFFKIPQIDLKEILILKNKDFKNSSIKNFTKIEIKEYDIKKLYDEKNFEELEKYINQKREIFLDVIKNV